MKFGQDDKNKKGKGGRSPSFGGGPSLATVLALEAQIAAVQQQAGSFATQGDVAAAVAAQAAAEAAANQAQDSAAAAANAAQDAAAAAEEMNDATEEATTDAEQAAQDSDISSNATDIANLASSLGTLSTSVATSQSAQDTRLDAIEAQLPDDDSALEGRVEDLELQIETVNGIFRVIPAIQNPAATIAEVSGCFVAQNTGSLIITINSDTVVAGSVGTVVTTIDPGPGPFTPIELTDIRNTAVYTGSILAERILAGESTKDINVDVVANTKYYVLHFAGGGSTTPVENILADLPTVVPDAMMYDDTAIQAAVAALQADSHDGAAQDARLDALEAAPDNDTIYDDTQVQADIAALELGVDGLEVDLTDVNDQVVTNTADIAAINAQLPDDDTALAQSIADNAAALAAEIADTDADVIALTATIAGNTTATAANAAAASANAADIVSLQSVSHDGAAQDARLDALEAPNYMLLDANQTVTGFNIFSSAQTFQSQTLFGTPGNFGVIQVGTGGDPTAFLVGKTSGGQFEFTASTINASNPIIANTSTTATSAPLSLVTKDFVDAALVRLDALEAWLAAGLPGQVPQVPDPDDEPVWVYPYGFEFQEAPFIDGGVTNTSNATPALVVGTVSTVPNPVGGRYEVVMTGMWSHDSLANDIILNMVRDDGAELVTMRAEPKDVAGAGTTDQRYSFILRRIVDVAAGTQRSYSLNMRPSVDGIESAVYDVQMTIMRVSD